MKDNPFLGEWSYRSFLRNPDLSVDFNALRFGAGIMIFTEAPFGIAVGTLGGEGWSLNLKGRCAFGNPNEIVFQGRGIIGEEEWVYDYHGFYTPTWPNGVEERPSIVGTIVRTVPHSNGQSEAGLVASWIAVKQ